MAFHLKFAAGSITQLHLVHTDQLLFQEMAKNSVNSVKSSAIHHEL